MIELIYKVAAKYSGTANVAANFAVQKATRQFPSHVRVTTSQFTEAFSISCRQTKCEQVELPRIPRHAQKVCLNRVYCFRN